MNAAKIHTKVCADAEGPCICPRGEYDATPVKSVLPASRAASYTVAELAAIVEMCRTAGVRSFIYGDLQLIFDGNKNGNARDALRNPALQALLAHPAGDK